MKKIIAKANKRNRTFTLRIWIKDKMVSKYRTVRMSKEEFLGNIQNTQNDWNNFLKSDDYYIIK